MNDKALGSTYAQAEQDSMATHTYPYAIHIHVSNVKLLNKDYRVLQAWCPVIEPQNVDGRTWNSILSHLPMNHAITVPLIPNQNGINSSLHPVLYESTIQLIGERPSSFGRWGFEINTVCVRNEKALKGALSCKCRGGTGSVCKHKQAWPTPPGVNRGCVSQCLSLSLSLSLSRVSQCLSLAFSLSHDPAAHPRLKARRVQTERYMLHEGEKKGRKRGKKEKTDEWDQRQCCFFPPFLSSKCIIYNVGAILSMSTELGARNVHFYES